MARYTKKCLKSLEKLAQQRKGFERLVKKKVDDFCESNTNPPIDSKFGWKVYKMKETSAFGAYRIILCKHEVTGKVVFDVYFKSTKEDLTIDEYKQLREILKSCEDKNYFDTLEGL